MAVASFLHARQASGQWLVRIEDIDPPREIPGASDQILLALEAFDLHWDGKPFFQSAYLGDYRQMASDLVEVGLAYHCSCSRRVVRKRSKSSPLGYRYPGTCRRRSKHARETAIRVLSDNARGSFTDGLQGEYHYDIPASLGDYVVFRNDDLPAYHLAVVVDDARQGITHVVRGVDLFELTGLQIHLQGLLGLPTPSYLHAPVIVNSSGQKLSKRTGATAVDATRASATACEVLGYLGLKPPDSMRTARPADLWDWALERWRIEHLREKKSTFCQSIHVGQDKNDLK